MLFKSVTVSTAMCIKSQGHIYAQIYVLKEIFEIKGKPPDPLETVVCLVQCLLEPEFSSKV